MAYSLRLPDTLDGATRAKAEYLGISINALVCVALDAYLRSPGEPASPKSEPAEPDSLPLANQAVVVRSVRREFTRPQSHKRKKR